jgi:hypothetical protein
MPKALTMRRTHGKEFNGFYDDVVLCLGSLLLGQAILRVGLTLQKSTILNRAQPEHPVAGEINDCRAIDF